MLQKLSIQNYAIIDELEIEFSDQLNVITGETGAGKSIIVGALGLILALAPYAAGADFGVLKVPPSIVFYTRIVAVKQNQIFRRASFLNACDNLFI